MTTANGSQQQPQQGAAWRLSEASWQTQSLLLPRLLTLMLSFLPAPNFVFAARWPSPSRQGETSDTAQPGAWREAQAERAQTSAGGKRFFFFYLFFFLSPELLQVVREGKVNCRVFKRKAITAAFCKEFGLSLQERQKPFCPSCGSHTAQNLLVCGLGFRHLVSLFSGAGLVQAADSAPY